jgi:HlyD family secretion protein
MDIKREGVARRKQIRLAVGLLLTTAVAAYAGWRVSLLKAALPSVDRASVWIDSVRRGPMVREVSGIGTLVAEDTIVIPAATDGRVERVYLLAGAKVEADTVLISLVNPELQQQKVDSDYSVKMAEAKLADLRVRLSSETLTMQAELARLESELEEARITLERDELLYKERLKVEIDYKRSKIHVGQLAGRVAIEQERAKIRKDSVAAQVAVQEAEIEKLKAMAGLKQAQVEALRVRAGVPGVLQEMLVSAGQQLNAGTVLAKIAQPSKLKAQLKIVETQAKDVALGQLVSIDTRSGDTGNSVIAGRVMRIDPAAREGTVLVDVQLEGPLPQGARMDLSVDGRIELERLRKVLYVGRPVAGQPNTKIGLFRLLPGTPEAARVPVALGRSSTNLIEVLGGLSEGDRVILSDMSAHDGASRIRLN